MTTSSSTPASGGLFATIIGGLLEQRVLVAVFVLITVGWGLYVAPFNVDLGVERDPVPVDAIPDIGENQQIVFTSWPGRSPQDVDDQVTYPLTVALLGIPDVRTIRSFSAFGFSTIYIIFEDEAEFYWSRSRVVEKLASLQANTLPAGVAPQLGPDATGLGQIFWYTIEGRDAEGNPAGGWDLHELRSIQDYQVRYALAAADGVSEVASIGGYVQEYQVDVDPLAMQAYGVTLQQVYLAVQNANAEVGARTTEISGVEYLIRGVGFLRSAEDLRQTVVAEVGNVPVRIDDVAHVALGPALRRGALDRGGAEAVGGVVVARYGENPMRVTENVQAAIAEVQQALPSRALSDGRVSQLTIVPFYDRAGLIEATIGTLEVALLQQILVTLLVVMIMMLHLRSSVLISSLLPLAVLATFVAMKVTDITANVVSLAGIAIAIGTMVDIGIVITENIVKRLEEAAPEADRLLVIREATAEVAGAVLTAVATTVVSFLPVFFLEGAEGKLFGPLAYTKTYAICASVVVALVVLPAAAWWLVGKQLRLSGPLRTLVNVCVSLAGVAVALQIHLWAGLLLVALGVAREVDARLGAHPEAAGWYNRPRYTRVVSIVANALAVAFVVVALASSWSPLGIGAGESANVLFVVLVVGGLLGLFWIFQLAYPFLLTWVLQNKLLFLSLPALLVAWGLAAWLGFGVVFAWLPDSVHRSPVGVSLHHAFPGIGQEFMPQLDEGSFLYMPSTMPHASIGEALRVTAQLDQLIESIPEVEYAVGKLGRAESALDPAPISMIETIIGYAPEFRVDANGRRQRFEVDESGEFVRNHAGEPVPDAEGIPYRNWRPEIRTQQDIWDEIVSVAQVPGLTSAPLLQPISARIVMLQSGIRAPMAIRLRGPDLQSLADASLAIEALLREQPMVNHDSVNADRPVGKPYIEITPDRRALARYGVTMAAVQHVIGVAIGGATITETVEGRERYSVRVRYPRELRDTPEQMARVLVAASDGTQVPLGELAEVTYLRGPQMIRSEDTSLVNYVMFGRGQGHAEVDVVESVRASLDDALARGDLTLPEGVSYGFAGSYENALRAQARLQILVPIVLLVIFLLLYLQFRSALTTLMVFTGISVALAGGFMMLWLYAQPGFLDVELLGANMRDVFQVRTINLSVAVWVGFIALFGIATDDGVVMATYLSQRFAEGPAQTVEEVRERVLQAGSRRVRPCLMTTATTILALLPILTSYGTGADVMIPMAVPAVGGMSVALITLFVVPCLYSFVEESRVRVRGLAASSARVAESSPAELE